MRLKLVGLLAAPVALLLAAACDSGTGTSAADAGADGDSDSDTDTDADADTDTDSDAEGLLDAVVIAPTSWAQIREGSLVDFEGAAEGGVPPYEYQWSFGELGGGSLEQNPAGIRLGSEGTYWCTLIVTDSLGATDEETIAIEATPLEGEMGFYFGNLHSHTGYSDGEGTPAEAWEFARYDAGLDFYAVTDHSEMLFGSEFEDTLTQANLANEPGAFLAIRGFEWSHPINGHMCIYGTDDYSSAYTSLWIDFIYDWIEERDALGQFNHPGREIGVFGNLALETEMLDNIFGIETGNKGDGVNDGEFLPYYVQALDNGWRVAPTNNQDNHSLSVNSHRTVFVGEELTKAGFSEAIAARRIYSTDDPDTRIVLRYGDAWMGEEISVTDAMIELDVKVVADEPLTLIRVVTDGGATAAELLPDEGESSVLWYPQVDTATSTYFYVEVTEEDIHDDDGPVQMAVSAPIWLI